MVVIGVVLKLFLLDVISGRVGRGQLYLCGWCLCLCRGLWHCNLGQLVQEGGRRCTQLLSQDQVEWPGADLDERNRITPHHGRYRATEINAGNLAQDIAKLDTAFASDGGSWVCVNVLDGDDSHNAVRGTAVQSNAHGLTVEGDQTLRTDFEAVCDLNRALLRPCLGHRRDDGTGFHDLPTRNKPRCSEFGNHGLEVVYALTFRLSGRFFASLVLNLFFLGDALSSLFQVGLVEHANTFMGRKEGCAPLKGFDGLFVLSLVEQTLCKGRMGLGIVGIDANGKSGIIGRRSMALESIEGVASTNVKLGAEDAIVWN
mmetsp:Transcript_27667/g.64894  ORF Transcript_27667/g.64894 Transcript_27667/m.64894 type:complete len:315 (+) Transcript_27667:164-1108(+)